MIIPYFLALILALTTYSLSGESKFWLMTAYFSSVAYSFLVYESFGAFLGLIIRKGHVEAGNKCNIVLSVCITVSN